MNLTDILAAFLPVGLMLMMLVVGLRLSLNDVVNAFRHPKALGLGLLVQLLALPVVAFGLAALFALPPAMAAGLVLVAAAPGGVTSNYISLLAKADIALSAAMTLVTTTVASLTIPLVLTLTGAADLSGLGSLAKLSAGMVAVALVPMALGMGVSHLWPRVSVRLGQWLEPTSRVVFVLMVVATFVQNWGPMQASLNTVGLACVALNLAALALAFGVGRFGGLTVPQTRSVMVEASLQNVAVALFLAGSVLKSPELAVPGLVYAVIMNVSALGQIFATRRGSVMAS